jgi:hypothetical protein
MIRNKVRRIAFTISLLALVTSQSNAELIPAARLVDWTAGVAVGVPGGIPTNRTRQIDVTASPYNADKTGGADATNAIQAAVNAAVANDVVYLPAGRYRVGGVITVNGAKDNVTIRGAGDSTIIDARGNSYLFAIGPGSDYAWASDAYAYPNSNNNVTAGLTKGSTVLTLPSTSAFGAGQMIQIALQNQTDPTSLKAGAIPTASVAGFGTLRRQMTRIVSKTATTVTIFPPVHFTPDSGLEARVNIIQDQLEGFGLENLYIDCSQGNNSMPVSLGQSYRSWIKGVTVYKPSNYGIMLNDSLNCEVRKCKVFERKADGSNGAGYLLGHVGNSLIEDNISYKIGPAIEVNFSSTGNVIAYNFFYNEGGGVVNVNHGPHNSFNLYEGNITPNIQSDGYFGSSSNDVFFRNWLTGKHESGAYIFTVSLNRFSRQYSLVGNIIGSPGWPYGPNPYSFGNPNMGNSSSTGSVQPSSGTLWADWNMTATLTTRTSDSSGTMTISGGGIGPGQYVTIHWATGGARFTPSSSSGKVVSISGASASLPPVGTALNVFAGAAGYQELDLDVGRTTLVKGNYLAWSEGGMSIPAAESVGSDVLPHSLFRSSKPEWFGDRPWPAFDPLSPVLGIDRIPAGYRYMNGSNNSPSSPNTSTAPTNVAIRRL